MKNTLKAIAIVGGACAVLGAIFGLSALLITLTNEHPKVVALVIVGVMAATVVTMVKHELDAADRRRQNAAADIAPALDTEPVR